MKKKDRTLLFLFAFAAFFIVAIGDTSKAQTQKDPEQSQNIIAIINGESITVEAYKKETILHGGHIPGRFDSMVQREALLEEMIRFEVLAAKARKAGYDKDPEIVASLKKMMVQKLWQDQWASKLKEVAITDDEIEQYYNKHLEDYTGPEMAKAAIIYLKFPPKATEKNIEGLKEKAETILKKAKKQNKTILSFDSLAKEYSDDRGSKYRGGDIGWVPKGARIFKWDKSVINAFFALKKSGDISPVITTTKGMYLVKLMDKKEGEVRSIVQVKRDIKKKLSLDKRKKAQEAYYQSIKKGFEIKINKDLLKSIEFRKKKPISKGRPPAFPVNVKN
jgi:parvulin-like peptidyl-prolyl isomerase